MTKRRPVFVSPPPPPTRRSFKTGDFVCRRDRPEREGQVLIVPGASILRERRLPSRVKVFWHDATHAYEWIYEADLMRTDVISELGRLA